MPNRYTSDGLSFVSDEDRAGLKDQFAVEYPDIIAKGYRIIVKPYIRPERTSGGIILSEIITTEDQFHSLICQVISVGPLAYTDEKFCGGVAWCDVGDWVVIPRVTGTRIPSKAGDTLRIVNEDDICAIVKDPADWRVRITSTKY